MKVFCHECRHHEVEDEEHLCYAEAEQVDDYITGEKRWEGVVFCEDRNFNG
jgi:hypothetical protein